ncbi:sulfite exporter TauE/SafE [archaeon BMS3Abin16]|nr:sulfite exporter TauE/SafE [archaeon BMS3Abin16]GBE56527.1 sulfite exporter TauE/SafE [archaeon BMS3Bbin16]HDY74798.1 sulfite exporter TauE/SafE family protein [Euryarchaeota archaeon]
MYFPQAGLELNPLIPVFVGAAFSLVFGQVGLTGSIGTLPFMVSILNFTSPSVSATNLIYNVLTPLGSVYSYRAEKRALWRLGLIAGAGGIIGSLVGPRIRVGLLADITLFKTLFGVLLILLGIRLTFKRYSEIRVGKIEKTTGTIRHHEFTFSDETYSFQTAPVLFAGILAGTISTTFGIGTGFLLVPFYTTILRLPIYAVAGSALLSTFIISSAGTISYATLNTGALSAPDIRLGLLLGMGGIVGGFVSAKIQRRMSSNTLHRFLGAALIFWSLAYLKQGF